MNLDLSNSTALVTASSGGIGLEIARSLAREGATVIVNGRSQSSVDSAIAEIKGTVPDAKLKGLVADNATAEGCAETIRQFPKVDILVNNLGIYEAVGFFEETDEAWLKLFEVNIMSGVRLARHYLKEMLNSNHGRVIFISSESAVNPAPEMAHYSATKTMQLSISRSLAELTKGTKVTVNTVMPGSTKTEGVIKFVQDVFPGLPYEEAERKFVSENRPTSLIQRLISPEEIADFVTFVCSSKASAINGAALRVDGGIVRSVV
ncbi:3-oxoacyl-[acyl-carrier protein] reductase [Roseimicrobium gellanilyticum]|uniref:3-oxoacyl-[acyl-carrier protein] reductase n=1 Tax=Roseimicrobium gellanilyticum TaxID=748857 RepID=A0A366HJZ4_9BACT|nr:SDR family oxidoreductase [Roseimicrobium gellanilyticum]RBP42564.1 3-oxoacyl-[acyl-carrier protein] reductase [Roseimicrobium gellanilyticum]